MDCSLPGSSVHGDSPGKSTGVGCHALLQGILPTQGLSPSPNCRQILYRLGHQGSTRILERVAYSFSRGTSWPRNWIRVSCISGRFFTSWAPKGLIHILKNLGVDMSCVGESLLTYDSASLIISHVLIKSWDSPCGSDSKVSACHVRDLDLILGSGRSPGEGNGNPLQYSCLKTPWTEEPCKQQSMGSQRVRRNWTTSLHFKWFVKSYQFCFYNLIFLFHFYIYLQSL